MAVLSFVLELVAFALIAVLLAVVFAPVWALLPAAVYLFIAANGVRR